MAQVFVSHAGDGLDIALRVRGWLRDAGHGVFLDSDLTHGLRVGDDWRTRLYDELYRADALVCIVTKAFDASPWCAAEIGIAQARGTRILPVRAEQNAAHRLLSTETTQWADLLTGGTERGRKGLLEALRGLDGVGGGMRPPGGSPYPGLRPFDTDQARLFFGRRAEAGRLAELLRASVPRGAGLLAVVGPSGCGKSSLVRAGLVPLLDAEPEWLVLPPLFPASDPIAALARVLVRAARLAGAPGWSQEEVGDRLDKPGGLDELATELLGAGKARHLLVVVDQAEELFTRTSDDHRREFAGLVQKAIEGSVRVVAALRSDYLDPLSLLAAGVSLPMSEPFPLAPLARDMLRLAVTGPARQAGIDVDDELANRLVSDAGGGEALPLLAFTLERLAAGVRRGEKLSIRRYEELGGVHGALAHQAEKALAAACKATGRTEAEVLAGLLQLVTIDEAGGVTRRRVTAADLPSPVHIELWEFVNRRLLSADRGAGDQVFDVTHERFLTEWDPLAKTIDRKSESLRQKTVVENAAADWRRSGRPHDHLWELGRAETAVASLDSAGLTCALAPIARDFLDSSRHRGKRRRRRLTTSLAALFLLLTALTGFAVVQWHGAVEGRDAAERARLDQVAASLLTHADTVRGTDPRATLRLSIAAVGIAAGGDTTGEATASSRARANLLDVLAATPHLRSSLAGPLGHSDAVTSVAFTGDGHTLATGSADRTAILWDVTDPANPRRLGDPLKGHPVAVGSVAITADGSLMATCGDDGTVILWDRADPSRMPRGNAMSGDIGTRTSIAFTAGGRILAAGGADGTVILRDVTDPANPQRLASLAPDRPGGAVRSMTFTGDTVLAIGYHDGTVILWDVAEPARPHRRGGPLLGHTGAVTSVAFTGDGGTLAAGSHDGTVRLWDVTDPTRPRLLGEPLRDPTGGAVRSIAFTADGSRLATGGDDGTVVLWDTRDPTRPHPVDSPLLGHTGAVTSVAFTGDGAALATGSTDATAILWDLATPTRPRLLGDPLRDPTGGAVRSIAFAGTTSTLATGGDDGGVFVWDARDPARPRLAGVLRGHTGTVWSLASTGDGHTLGHRKPRHIRAPVGCHRPRPTPLPRQAPRGSHQRRRGGGVHRRRRHAGRRRPRRDGAPLGHP
jgi:WD40 repeat protein